MNTLSRFATKRSANSTGVSVGLNFLIKSLASSGMFARNPPFYGSITITSKSCFLATS